VTKETGSQWHKTAEKVRKCDFSMDHSRSEREDKRPRAYMQFRAGTLKAVYQMLDAQFGMQRQFAEV